jgi:type IV pilus assembly protein PilB
LAIHEVMTVTEQIERLTVEHAPATVLATVAAQQGMTSLRSDGLDKVAQGLTSLEEVLRVVV